MLRTPSPSIFRPRHLLDQGALKDNKELLRAIDRRGVLRGGRSP